MLKCSNWIQGLLFLGLKQLDHEVAFASLRSMPAAVTWDAILPPCVDLAWCPNSDLIIKHICTFFLLASQATKLDRGENYVECLKQFHATIKVLAEQQQESKETAGEPDNA